MKKQIKLILFIAGGLLIAGNMFLILKDDSKIERSAYIKNFLPAEKENIKQSFHTKAIVAPEEESYYFYDQKMGSFKQFFVKKGEEVEAGTPLYEYISADIEADLARTKAKKEKIESEISVLEKHIRELTDYRDSLSFDEEEKAIERSIIHSIDQDISNKQLQADMLRQTADSVDQELKAIQTSEGKLTVVSEVDGIVKDVNVSLGNPLITISSAIPTIQGNLNEEERNMVEIGIPAVVSTKKGKLNGTLAKADHLPDGAYSEQKASQYPFSIQLDDEAPDLLQGSHVDVTFITNEINGALMIPKQSVVKKKKGSFVWIINSSGKLEEREIKTGVKSDHNIQVKSGVEKGELIVSDPSAIKKGEGPSIYSPINLAKLEISEIKEMRKKHILKYMLKGFLIR
ncbi:efflux RND transporter periplasmic adaptor subunit [Cytobacillus dafuensis]|uniref:RND transporter n=1 Tax=Cytobacillus dafuensis TaxID=1742359 RepID=A0A5B8Z9P0_CYTDA|nr:hypothetical protein [Cytobacillus dafuensis]QED49644.1 RND transporter [Cytobacillus dafuensis]